MRNSWPVWLLLLGAVVAPAQTTPEIRQILDRLERLEKENRALADEVRLLREQLAGRPAAAPEAAAQPPAPERDANDRLAIQERRTEELAQTKVEASQKLPVTLTGMVLFNGFWNSRYDSSGTQYPTTAQPVAGHNEAGASPRQSIVGLRFDGPTILGGGKVSAWIYTDFFSGTSSSLNHVLRIRTASVRIDWKDTAIQFGQEKPIIAPREPRSLAQVGVSPLTAAGNLWLWQPQFKVEQKLHAGQTSGFDLQAGVFQTSEGNSTLPSDYASTLASSRPGWEGRLEFWKSYGEDRRIELASGFHASNTHVLGASVPSRIVSADWLIQPARWVDFSGAYFHGENVSVLGSMRQGFTIFNGYYPEPVHADGGWGQLTLRATSRLSFNLMTGQQDDRNSDLAAGAIAKNLAFGGNVFYKLGPNVLASAEAMRIRTTYLGPGTRGVNHYDLGLAYLF